MRWFFLCLMLCCFSRETYSFVPTYDSVGNEISWPDGKNEFVIYVQTENSLGISNSDLKIIFEEIANDFEEKTGVKLALVYDEKDESLDDLKIDIFFSSNQHHDV